MKALVRVGYDTYAMDVDKALTLLELVATSEKYEEKYNSETRQTAFYVYPVEPREKVKELKLISDDLYKMASLAGKPIKD